MSAATFSLVVRAFILLFLSGSHFPDMHFLAWHLLVVWFKTDPVGLWRVTFVGASFWGFPILGPEASYTDVPSSGSLHFGGKRECNLPAASFKIIYLFFLLGAFQMPRFPWKWIAWPRFTGLSEFSLFPAVLFLGASAASFSTLFGSSW